MAALGYQVSSCSGENQDMPKVHEYQEHSSIKYEVQLVICKDVSSFLVGENHLQNQKMTMVPDRAQAMQRKSVSTASGAWHRSIRRPCTWNSNRMQNSVKA